MTVETFSDEPAAVQRANHGMSASVRINEARRSHDVAARLDDTRVISRIGHEPVGRF